MARPDPFKPDEDNPELTDEQLAEFRPAAEILGEAFVSAQRRPGGRPRLERTKPKVTLRLDVEVLEHFRAGGPGWQTRINDALRREIERKG